MQGNHEELLAKNPILLARLFWHVARKFSETSGGKSPSLPVFLLSGGLLLHRETVEKVHRMNFDSRFVKMVVERPDLIVGLQGRVEMNSRFALMGVQLGVNVALLQRDGGLGFPTFRAIGGVDLPAELRSQEVSSAALIGAAKRLGAWFALEELDSVQRQLIVEF
ncbi:DUF6521 family protein [Asticcacaulis sp. BYS171W]|uniref:DUF6521 family protein n=1 Tax=Asticcacaulis aquaticus TaxID=2984212 RepID=A0ABT5HQT7_9CAUL|nr:three component ABC system middle component [Asticcacaulis aquaticus]MDC7682190.1 DUF6521 family protein [Asticcacaulis aquaticus]